MTHILATNSVVSLVIVPAVAAGLTTLVTLAVTRTSEAVDRRRKGYAEAVATLVAWVEFPYRIRRRVDDNPATLTALAGLGHDLQQQLAAHEAWIATDRPDVADTYHSIRDTLGSPVGDAIAEAWKSPPITTAAGMNLGPWGPGAVAKPHIAQLQAAVETRFGWRRVTAALRRDSSS